MMCFDGWSDSGTIVQGDTIWVYGPPPLTWWDEFLWRVFRVERKREPVLRKYIVTVTTEITQKTKSYFVEIV